MALAGGAGRAFSSLMENLAGTLVGMGRGKNTASRAGGGREFSSRQIWDVRRSRALGEEDVVAAVVDDDSLLLLLLPLL